MKVICKNRKKCPLETECMHAEGHEYNKEECEDIINDCQCVPVKKGGKK